MKTLLLLAALVLPFSSLAGENEPDWEYTPYPFAPYSVTIPGDDDTVAVLVGTICPSGLRISRDVYTVGEFQTILQNMVDGLVESENSELLLIQKAAKTKKVIRGLSATKKSRSLR